MFCLRKKIGSNKSRIGGFIGKYSYLTWACRHINCDTALFVSVVLHRLHIDYPGQYFINLWNCFRPYAIAAIAWTPPTL